MTPARWQRQIFVFGSNLEGRHGKGAALIAARAHGAEEGVAEGLTGQAYALPTKGLRAGPGQPFPILSRNRIRAETLKLVCCATAHRDWRFNVTAFGCGLAGYQPAEIAPFFELADDLDNLFLPVAFVKCLPHWLQHQISFDEKDRLVPERPALRVVGRRGYHRTSAPEGLHE